MKEKFEILGLAGGGFKCTSYLGSLQALKQIGLFSQINTLIGTSGGAILSALLSVGFSLSTIERIVAEFDLSLYAKGLDNETVKNSEQLLSGNLSLESLFSAGKLIFNKNLSDFFKQPGLVNLDQFRENLDKLISTALMDQENAQYATFGDLKKAVNSKKNKGKFRHLHVVTIQIDKKSGTQKIVIFNSEDDQYADTVISRAVLGSAAIPVIFPLCQQYVRDENGKEKLINEETFYLDGGVLYNDPLTTDKNKQMLSLRFKISNEINDEKKSEKKSPNFLELFKIIANIYYKAEKIQKNLLVDDNRQIIEIDLSATKATTLSFYIAQEDKEELASIINCGKQAVYEYFNIPIKKMESIMQNSWERSNAEFVEKEQGFEAEKSAYFLIWLQSCLKDSEFSEQNIDFELYQDNLIGFEKMFEKLNDKNFREFLSSVKFFLDSPQSNKKAYVLLAKFFYEMNNKKIDVSNWPNEKLLAYKNYQIESKKFQSIFKIHTEVKEFCKSIMSKKEGDLKKLLLNLEEEVKILDESKWPEEIKIWAIENLVSAILSAHHKDNNFNIKKILPELKGYVHEEILDYLLENRSASKDLFDNFKEKLDILLNEKSNFLLALFKKAEEIKLLLFSFPLSERKNIFEQLLLHLAERNYHPLLEKPFLVFCELLQISITKFDKEIFKKISYLEEKFTVFFEAQKQKKNPSTIQQEIDWKETLSQLIHSENTVNEIDKEALIKIDVLLEGRGKGYLNSNVQDQIFKFNKEFKLEKKLGANHIVSEIKLNDNKLFFKINPDDIGTEYKVRRLLSGLNIDLGEFEILVFPAETGGEKTNYPVLVTKKIEGISLDQYLKAEDPDKGTQFTNFGDIFLKELLTVPCDGKSNNFIVTNDNKIIPIDNDLSFGKPVSKDGKVNLISIIFCCSQIFEPMSEKFVDKVLAINTYDLLKNWLGELKEYNDNIAKRFDKKEMQTFYDRYQCSTIPIILNPIQIKELYQKIESLKDFLQEDGNKRKRYIDVLMFIYPEVALFYTTSFNEQNEIIEKIGNEEIKKSVSKNTEERFYGLFGDRYDIKTNKLTGESILQTTITSRKIIEEQLQNILNIGNEFNYRELKIEQATAFLEGMEKEVQDIKNHVEKFKSGKYPLSTKLTSKQARDKVLREIDFKNQSEETQKLWLENIKNAEFGELNLKNCTVLTDKDLLNFLKTSKNIRKLNISGCTSINEEGLMEALSCTKSLEFLDISHLTQIYTLDFMEADTFSNKVGKKVNSLYRLVGGLSLFSMGGLGVSLIALVVMLGGILLSAIAWPVYLVLLVLGLGSAGIVMLTSIVGLGAYVAIIATQLLAKYYFGNLTKINISGCKNLYKLRGNFPALNSINLSNTAISDLETNSKEIIYFNAQNCSFLTDDSLPKIGQIKENSAIVIFKNCKKITDCELREKNPILAFSNIESESFKKALNAIYKMSPKEMNNIQCKLNNLDLTEISESVFEYAYSKNLSDKKLSFNEFSVNEINFSGTRIKGELFIFLLANWKDNIKRINFTDIKVKESNGEINTAVIDTIINVVLSVHKTERTPTFYSLEEIIFPDIKLTSEQEQKLLINTQELYVHKIIISSKNITKNSLEKLEKQLDENKKKIKKILKKIENKEENNINILRIDAPETNFPTELICKTHQDFFDITKDKTKFEASENFKNLVKTILDKRYKFEFRRIDKLTLEIECTEGEKQQERKLKLNNLQNEFIEEMKKISVEFLENNLERDGFVLTIKHESNVIDAIVEFLTTSVNSSFFQNNKFLMFSSESEENFTEDNKREAFCFTQ